MISRVLCAVALAAGVASAAANRCPEEEGGTGLHVAVETGRLIVDGEPTDAAAGAVRDGDVVVQANATVLHSCGEWSRAVRDAKRDRKALLLLLDRGGTQLPALLPASTWGVPAPTPAEPGVAAKPSFPAPPPPPPPLPDTVVVSYASIRQELDALAPADDLPTSLTDYRRTVSQVRRAIATLSLRQAAPLDAVNALRVALRPFEAAEVAWDAMEGERERERRSRKLPMAEEAGSPFFQDSQVAAVLDEFPFLRATVTRDPDPGLVETAGSWRPVQARQLLWEHARAQLATLPATR